MNERIDELAFQAGCNRHRYCNKEHPELDGYIINQEALDKFADLILEDVVEAIRSAEDCDPDYIVFLLKRRYGVK